ncbi:MAG: hypothetical protein Ta2B_07080 [Termitinemataceae bacterium]|nr:MAG: hypothetical protein Ta2B_07080 [Termitinemataceae bacterium]
MILPIYPKTVSSLIGGKGAADSSDQFWVSMALNSLYTNTARVIYKKSTHVGVPAHAKHLFLKNKNDIKFSLINVRTPQACAKG